MSIILSHPSIYLKAVSYSGNSQKRDVELEARTFATELAGSLAGVLSNVGLKGVISKATGQ